MFHLLWVFFRIVCLKVENFLCFNSAINILRRGFNLVTVINFKNKKDVKTEN